MKKGKEIALPLVLLLGLFIILGLIGLFLNSEFYRHSIHPVEDELPLIALVNDTLYCICPEHEEDTLQKIDGTIKVITPRNKIPFENESANFGKEGMEYHLGDGCIYLSLNGKIFKLKETENNH